jgi:Fe-S-cluster containining protein
VTPAKDFDCTRCGACCANSDENRREGYLDYVQIEPHAPLRRKPELMRRFAVVNEQGETHLRLDGDQRCSALRGALGRRVWCEIYELRPAGCRRVERGSAACLTARRERGIGT